MLKGINLLFAILVLTGCSIKQPYITEYKIAIEDFSQNQNSKNM